MHKTHSIVIAVSSFVAGIALAVSCSDLEMQDVDAETPADCTMCAAQAAEALASRIYTVSSSESLHTSNGSAKQIYSNVACRPDDIKLSGDCWVSSKEPLGFTDTLGNTHRLIGSSHMQGLEDGREALGTHICLYDNEPEHEDIVKVTATIVCLRVGE